MFSVAKIDTKLPEYNFKSDGGWSARWLSLGGEYRKSNYRTLLNLRSKFILPFLPERVSLSIFGFETTGLTK